MTMQTDVLAKRVSASGVVFPARCRLRHLIFLGSGTAGGIILYDNATTGAGNIILQVDSGTAASTVSIVIPGEGILVYNGIYAALTNVTGLTVLYS